MKRILFIITDYGSFNNFLGEISVALKKSEFSVEVICSPSKVIKNDDKHEYKKLGVNFHFINLPRAMSFLDILKSSFLIKRKINEIKPDIISAHFTTGIFTTLMLGKPKYKIIGTFHGLGYPVTDNLLKKYFFKIIELYSCYLLDQIWLLNQYDFNLISKKYPQKSFLLPTKGVGCNLNSFDMQDYKRDREKLKDKLGIEENDFVVAYTGRFVDFKGFHFLIKAFKELLEDGVEDIKLLLMGGEDPARSTGLDKEEKLWYEQTKEIIKIGFTSEVAKYLSITDIFVFPSKKEGMPVCIMEALAMEVPVITTNSRGCIDLVEHKKTGFILPEGFNASELAKTILEIKENRTELDKLKANIVKDRESLSRDRFVEYQVEYFKKELCAEQSFSR